MSRPLLGDPKQFADADVYHKAVFKRYGSQCVLCRAKAPATDAAHIIPKAILGPLRYRDVRLARPVHRACHGAQHDGLKKFPVDIVRDAYKAHNEIAKCKLVCPV